MNITNENAISEIIRAYRDLTTIDPVKIHEAEQAALTAIRARITLWNDLQRIIETKDHLYYKSEC